MIRGAPIKSAEFRPRRSSLPPSLDVDNSLAQSVELMFQQKLTSFAANDERIERKPTIGQTIVHRWEVTYTCAASGNEAQLPFRPVVVYSRQGGSDADTPRPTLCIAVESADVREEPESQNGTAASTTSVKSEARPPALTVTERFARTEAGSGGSGAVSSASTPHRPGNTPASRRQTAARTSRERSPRRARNADRRRSASPPRRRSDKSRPARRAEDMTSWTPNLHTRKIRGCDESTEWSESHSEHSIRAVPAALLRNERDRKQRLLSLGHLHLHIHNRGVQTWMLVGGTVPVRRERDSGWGSKCRSTPAASAADNAPEGVRSANPELLPMRRWIPATIGTKHPRFKGYVLHFLDSGEPGFVLAASARNYAAGRKKRKSIARMA